MAISSHKFKVRLSSKSSRRLDLDVMTHFSKSEGKSHVGKGAEAGLLNKCSCLARALGVTKFPNV
jgi:hypothetical protein